MRRFLLWRRLGLLPRSARRRGGDNCTAAAGKVGLGVLETCRPRSWLATPPSKSGLLGDAPWGYLCPDYWFLLASVVQLATGVVARLLLLGCSAVERPGHGYSDRKARAVLSDG